MNGGVLVHYIVRTCYLVQRMYGMCTVYDVGYNTPGGSSWTLPVDIS